MTTNIELEKPRDFGEIINDTFIFIRQNFKPLLKYFFIFCGFFLVASTATSILTQINMVRNINNFNPNSFDADNRFAAFSFLTPTYFLTLFFVLLEYISISVMVLSYMTLYKKKQNQAPEMDEMWGYFKFYFFNYSTFKFFTGFARAALIAWKLTVINAMRIAPKPANINIHKLISMR